MNIQDKIRETVQYNIFADNFNVCIDVSNGDETWEFRCTSQSSQISEETRTEACVLLALELQEEGVDVSDLKDLPTITTH